MAWIAAAVVLLISMRFGMRGLLFGLVMAALLVWSSRTPRRVSGTGSGGGRGAGPMSHEEALKVLGLEAGASAEAVMKAHRELIKKVHPDQGGSSFLTQQVNEAKQVLLKR
ncbi:MAG TPA: DnaJ domain-containing protein [Polyangiaceae bacterium]|nr:DnaJ domain-containing protein [Polyangiaceae bacterium]